MKRAKRTIDYTMGTSIKLDDIREIVSETDELSGQASVEIQPFVGQREETYYHLIITEHGDPM